MGIKEPAMTNPNPYTPGTPRWRIWNLGFEDGCRGDEHRYTPKKSRVYDAGWQTGIKHFRNDIQIIARGQFALHSKTAA
ncbi:hypothetical protein C4556_00630 [Candidatus Parcubacteria bacterium]|nr:MAG: hypothetical protein C4556_00630 [Candidatus Parcubacteria bacterium]